MRRALWARAGYGLAALGFIAGCGHNRSGETPGAWTTYEVYSPRVERHYVVNQEKSELKYNHCATLGFLRGRFVALWNANTVPSESKPGQLIYMSVSENGADWSSPELAFANPERSENPVYARRVQWQPVVLDVASVALATGEEELWCFWSQFCSENYGMWFSRLSSPDGKWVNRRLKWNGSADAVFDGKAYRVMPMQNAVRLSSGRILVPVMLQSHWDAPSRQAPDSVTWNTVKRNSVVYSDDAGRTWHVSPGTIHPEMDYAQWEPTVWEQPDGTVAMLARHNHPEHTPGEGPEWAKVLMWSESTDGGEHWAPMRPVPIETVVSRMHVMRADDGGSTPPPENGRFIMIHNDARHNEPFYVRDRDTLALFFNRGGGYDFVAGIGLTGHETVVNYPHLMFRDNTLFAIYTEGVGSGNIKVAEVVPRPDPDRYYLLPRSRAFPDSQRPLLKDGALYFRGGQFVQSRTSPDLESRKFSAGAWVRPEIAGALMDNRKDEASGGMLWMGVRGRPSLLLNGVGRLVPADHPWMRHWNWNYLGISVDAEQGTVLFYTYDKVGGEQVHEMHFDPLKFQSFSGGPVRIGSAIDGSGVRGMTGRVRALEMYAGSVFSVDEHRAVRDRLAYDFGHGGREQADRSVSSEPVFRLNPSDADSMKDLVFPKAGKGGTVERIDETDGTVLRFHGESSAGVELPANVRRRGDRVRFAFSFRADEDTDAVLCTVGDAVDPARIFVRDGRVWVATRAGKVVCGPAKAGAWNRVELVTYGDLTEVRSGGSSPVRVMHEPVATWIYLGQGYRTGEWPSEKSFDMRVSTVKSRVE